MQTGRNEINSLDQAYDNICNKGFLPETIAYLQAHCKQNPLAAHYLGICYRNGFGITKDLIQASKLLHKAAKESKDVTAIYELALVYDEQSKDAQGKKKESFFKMAEERYSQATQLGHKNAKHRLALLYACESFFRKKDLGLKMIEELAMEGHPLSQYQLVHFHIRMQEKKEAIHWLKKMIQNPDKMTFKPHQKTPEVLIQELGFKEDEKETESKTADAGDSKTVQLPFSSDPQKEKTELKNPENDPVKPTKNRAHKRVIKALTAALAKEKSKREEPHSKDKKEVETQNAALLDENRIQETTIEQLKKLQKEKEAQNAESRTRILMVEKIVRDQQIQLETEKKKAESIKDSLLQKNATQEDELEKLKSDMLKLKLEAEQRLQALENKLAETNSQLEVSKKETDSLKAQKQVTDQAYQVLEYRADQMEKKLQEDHSLIQCKIPGTINTPEIAKTVLGILMKAGATRAYTVGGIVRESIKKTKETTDIDIRFGAKEPKKVMELLQSELKDSSVTMNPKCYELHLPDGTKIDLRHSVPLSDSKKTNLEAMTADANLCDLTRNSLFGDEEIAYDPTGRGYRDILTDTLATVTDPVASFTEDPTRILRLIHQSSSSGIPIPVNLIEAVRHPSVTSALIKRIQENPVEINSMLNQLFCKSDTLGNWYLMRNLGIFPILFPHFANLDKKPKVVQYLRDNLQQIAEDKAQKSLNHVYTFFSIASAKLSDSTPQQIKESEVLLSANFQHPTSGFDSRLKSLYSTSTTMWPSSHSRNRSKRDPQPTRSLKA